MNIRPSAFALLAIVFFASLSACSSHKDPTASEITQPGMEHMTDQSKLSVTEQDDYIARQKEEMKRQERELEDLRRQKFHDEYFRSQYDKRAE